MFDPNSHISGEDSIDQVLLREVEGALQFVVVKRNFSRAGAVQTSLHKGGPGVLQEETAAHIVFTHPGHTGEHRLPTVIFNSSFSQEEVGKVTDVVHRHKVGLWGGRGSVCDVSGL